MHADETGQRMFHDSFSCVNRADELFQCSLDCIRTVHGINTNTDGSISGTKSHQASVSTMETSLIEFHCSGFSTEVNVALNGQSR